MRDNLVRLFAEPQAEPSKFEDLWKVWPNKSKKPLARAKYEAIIKGGFKTRTLDRDSGLFMEIELDATHDAILSGAMKYVSSQLDRNTYRLKDDGKYIPHLATWLNGGRWEDFS